MTFSLKYAIRSFVQDLYFLIFGRDFMTHVSYIPSPYNKLLVHLNWPNSRAWNRISYVSCQDKSLVFIHIPKCAGTSISDFLKIPNVHMTSSVLLLSNPERFKSSLSFSVIRNPLERRLAILRHMASSPLSQIDDRRKYQLFIKKLLESGNYIDIYTDPILRRRAFLNTTSGRSGFASVNQLDWIRAPRASGCSNIAVDYLIPMNNSLTDNLSAFFTYIYNSPVKFDNYLNSSKVSRNSSFHLDLDITELEHQDRRIFYDEWSLWDSVVRHPYIASKALPFN